MIGIPMARVSQDCLRTANTILGLPTTRFVSNRVYLESSLGIQLSSPSLIRRAGNQPNFKRTRGKVTEIWNEMSQDII
ncbi:hypothetical protein TNCV_2239501 [Trichonephila clavipes]|nr:hypothetical protein TNCV_2239501 [Trichonephila clavipes]